MSISHILLRPSLSRSLLVGTALSGGGARVGKERMTAAEIQAELQRRMDALIGSHRNFLAPSPQPVDRGPYLANWTITDMDSTWSVCDQVVGIAAELMMKYDLA